MITFLLIALLAPPTDAQAESRLVKAVKEAERAAFEQHRLPGYLALFTPDAVWTHGRSATPDAHDVVYTRASKEGFLRLELAAPPSRDKRLFFEGPQVDLAANPPYLQVKIGRHFFGGRDLIEVRYTLRPVGGAFKVAAVRTWSLEEQVADVHLKFTDEFFKHADGLADAPGTPTPEEVLENLRWARRYGQAHALTIALTEAPDATAQHWRMRAETALRAGQLDDARLAMKRGRAIDPLLEAPPLLREKR